MSKQHTLMAVAVMAIHVVAMPALHAQGPSLAGGQGGMGGGAPRVRIGFGGGATVPTRDAGDFLKRGVNGQAFVLLSLGSGLPPVRINLGYQKFDYKDLLSGGVTSGESQVVSGVAGLSINLVRLGPVRPYLLAGLGAFNVKDQLTSSTSSATTSSVSETRFGIDGGGGIALKLGRLEAFVEGRLQNVYTSDKGVVDRKSIQYVPVTFGIIF